MLLANFLVLWARDRTESSVNSGGAFEHESFAKWQSRHMGLFTFAHSPKHAALYLVRFEQAAGRVIESSATGDTLNELAVESSAPRTPGRCPSRTALFDLATLSCESFSTRRSGL